MENIIRLCNNHTLFVGGASTREEAAAILALSQDQTPIGLMFKDSGIVTVKVGDGEVLNIPFRHIRLEDRGVVTQTLALEHEGQMIQGLGIGLPDDAVRLHAAYEMARKGLPYNWDDFLSSYRKDLEKIGSLFLDYVDTARLNGMQAQVITDPRVGENEVGLNTQTMEKLHKRLIKTNPELRDVDTLDGMWVLLQRYPVVGPNGARWVQLRLIKGAVSDKLLVNAKAWKELHDGDEDGDEGYIGVGQFARVGGTTPLPEFPKIELIQRDDLPEKKDANPVGTTMNMLAKDLTGSQHAVFHGLARAAGVRCAAKGTTPEEMTALFDRAVTGTFEIYRPLVENVMDKRKSEDGMTEFMAVVNQIESGRKGEAIKAEPFFPFLDENLQVKLQGVLGLVGGNTASARNTAFGRVLMAGQNGRDRAFAFVIDALTGLGIDPIDMLSALQNDATGHNLLFVPQPQKRMRKEATKWELVLDVDHNITNLKGVFENIKFNNQPVLKVVGMAELENGCIEVGVLLQPVWKKMTAAVPVISVLLPKIRKVSESDDQGHRFVSLPGMGERMFKPIFRLVDGEVVKLDLKHFLADTIKKAVESFSKRRWNKVDKQRFQDHMDRAVRSAIRDLVQMDENGKEALIRMSEFDVEVTGEMTVTQKWAVQEELLTKLHEMGYDVVTTSKNKPGTIVTRTWKLGVPRFLFAVNPFATDLDLKRRVEIREIRKALELANPIPAPINTKGCKIPGVLADCITTLNVVVADLKGLNVFEGTDGPFCFDTLLVTQSGVDKLALKKLGFHAVDEEEKNNIIDKLVAEGFTEDQIVVEEVDELLGDGLMSREFDIVVTGPVTDIGKIKATVGPIKGVMNPVPFRMFDADGNEIDIIVPHDTIVRKRAVDAIKYMMAAKAGITEIDPDNLPEIEIKKTMIVLEDGTEVGECITGPLPFYRPVQTGRSTFDIRTGVNGIKVQYHAMIMGKQKMNGQTIDRVRFNQPAWVAEDFAQIVDVRRKVMSVMAARAEMDEYELIEN